jgi:Tol biopolymer transport system component
MRNLLDPTQPRPHWQIAEWSRRLVGTIQQSRQMKPLFAFAVVAVTNALVAEHRADDSHSPPGKAQVAPKALKGEGLIALPLRDSHGHLQVFTIRPDGTGKKQLTFEGQSGVPAWSRDGKSIVFMSIRNDHAWVAVMEADGSDQRMLTEGMAPDWSPDGRQIAFSSADGQIWTMNADGSEKNQVTHSRTYKARPSWSPDAKRMAFILIRNPQDPADPQPQIGIVNADGTHEELLTKEKRENVRIGSDGAKTLLETAYDANAPSWSPVDDRIAFWSGIETRYGQIWVMRADGSGSTQLTDDPGHRNSDDPSWSPDGRKILFSTGRSGRNELWVMNADGTGQKRLSDIDAGPFPGRASWQPVEVSRNNEQ